MEIVLRLAFENHWNWGFDHLSTSAVTPKPAIERSEDAWTELSDSVRQWKVGELKSIWGVLPTEQHVRDSQEAQSIPERLRSLWEEAKPIYRAKHNRKLTQEELASLVSLTARNVQRHLNGNSSGTPPIRWILAWLRRRPLVGSPLRHC